MLSSLMSAIKLEDVELQANQLKIKNCYELGDRIFKILKDHF